MSVAISAPPVQVRVLRAPPTDPPFDDELSPLTYRPPLPDPTPAPPARSPVGASGECYTAALRFMSLCLEVFNSFRSPAQLRPLLQVQHSIEILDELTRALRLLATPRRKRSVQRRHMRICEPIPGVAEVAGVLTDGTRVWAIAFRLEHSRGQWRCRAFRALLK